LWSIGLGFSRNPIPHSKWDTLKLKSINIYMKENIMLRKKRKNEST